MQDIEPIHLGIGDQLTLTYREETSDWWHGPQVKETELLTDTFTEARTVDRVAVVELEGGELSALGMEQGIAGVFGKRV